VFAHHRLKSSWSLANGTARLDSGTFTNSFLGRVEVDCVDGLGRTHFAGQFADFQEAQRTHDSGTLVDHWKSVMADGLKVFELRWDLPLERSLNQCAVLLPTDARLTLTVTHSTPQVWWGSEPRIQESVALVPAARMTPNSRQSRSFTADDIEIKTAFNLWDYWHYSGGMGPSGALQSW
jgi:hypothetical protein